MPNALAPFAARAVLYLHPELNGLVQIATSEADEIFGTQPAPVKLPGDYARRLQWADGRPLTEPPVAWSRRKPVLSERPRQQELFREVA